VISIATAVVGAGCALVTSEGLRLEAL